MFIGDIKPMVAHPDELITLQELMFRWSYEPIEKICYELYTGRFTNITISEVIKTRPTEGDGEDRVYYYTIPWHFDQRSPCSDFNRLAVFKKEVEAAECDNPLYSVIDTTNSRRIWYERCNIKNYRRIAPLILYVNFRLVAEPVENWKVLFRVHIKRFIDSDEIFSPSNCLPAPKKSWIIPERATQPLLRAKPLTPPPSQTIDHEYLDALIAEHRARGVNTDEELCRVLLVHAPHITGASVARHIYNIDPNDERLREAAKRRGNRLKKRTRKLFNL